MSEDTTTPTELETVQAPQEEQPEELDTQAVQAETEPSSDEADTTDQTESSEEDELKEWAEKKGIKTDNTVALLKMVRESEKQMHNATKQAKELQATVKTVGEEAGFDETSQLLNRLKVTDFYLNNPDAKQLDEQMAEIVTSKPYLADDLETVYELAKARNQPVKDVEARKVGQKEALAQVAKAEKAAPPNASATTRQSITTVTDQDIANMSAAEYVQWKKDTGFVPFQD